MTSTAWSSPEIERLAEHVSLRTGLVFAPHRIESFERAVRTLGGAAGVESLRELLPRLEPGERMWDELMAEITVGETSFFRDAEHFSLVKTEVLPGILQQRGASHGPRVWSAGCASGEEPYSLAILLYEQGLLERAQLLATDLSPRALARARAARYRPWSLRNVERELVARYFRSDGAELCLCEAIRRRVRFETLNLARAEYPSLLGGTSDLDLIFCRNVLLYLDAATIAGVARRFHDALAPGGWLILGPSDPLLASVGFEVRATPVGLVYRRPLYPGRRSSSRPAERAHEGLIAVRRAVAAKSARERPLEPGPALPRTEAPHQETTPVVPRDADSLLPFGVRTAWNLKGAAEAERLCADALEQQPLNAELHYLHGMLLLEGLHAERAARALRRALYLDRSLAIAHFALGSVLSQLKDFRRAARASRSAYERAQALPADSAVRCGDGITAQGLAAAAAHELARIERVEGRVE